MVLEGHLPAGAAVELTEQRFLAELPSRALELFYYVAVEIVLPQNIHSGGVHMLIAALH